MWGVGFKVSLEFGVLFSQLGDLPLIVGALLLSLVELASQALNFALHAVDMLAKPLEKSGTTTSASPTEREIRK